MNCTELDAALSDTHGVFVESDVGFALLCGALLGASVLLLGFGERVVRPASAVAGALAAAVAVFVLTAALDLECAARLVASGVAAVAAAVLALCIFRTGLFLLGAVGFGGVAHLVYESLGVEATPVLLGRSGDYYLVMGATVGVGAIVAWVQKKEFVRIGSALLGGGGLAFTVHLVVDRAGEDVPALALLILLIVSTVGGVTAQRVLAARRARKRVPVGVPVTAA